MRKRRKRDKHEHRERIPPLPPHLQEAEGGPGREYIYEAGCLLAARADADRVGELVGGLADVESVRVEPVAGLGVARVEFSSDAHTVPEVVGHLRETAGPDVRAGPNHVLGRATHASLMSVTPPRPAVPRASLYEEPDLPGEGIRVGVPDTGSWEHPYFGGRCDFRSPEDDDEPDADGDGLLDYAAGHGTFIAGLVLQHAPRATVVARRLPSEEHGEAPHQDYVTDAQLALGLAALPELGAVDVLTLAVGGYTHDGMGLIATEALLQDYLAANPGLVVVAGAGNDRQSEPFFPAALKYVVGVGALDASGQRRACFSNYGWWVDACAPGVRAHSTFLDWSDGLARYPDVPHHCAGQLDLDPDPDVDGFEGFAYWDGTSFAAPRVAAAVAARMSQGRSGPEAVFDVLHAPGVRRLPLLGTVVNPQSYP